MEVVRDSRDALQALFDWLRGKGQEVEGGDLLISTKADPVRGRYYQIILCSSLCAVFLVFPDGTIEDVCDVLAPVGM